MTATNHVLTGTLIGLTLHQPIVAIIAAIVSHFVLDALPHYGDNSHTKKRFIIVLFTDMVVASLVLLAIVIIRPLHWQLSLICAILAASADLMWLPMWLRELRHKPIKFDNPIKKFHKKIQWAEHAKNYPYEILWAVSCVILIIRI